MNLATTTFKCLLAAALVALAGCASLATQQAEYPVGRVRLALPAGAWEGLGVRVSTGMMGGYLAIPPFPFNASAL